jgi:hypothetical protein
MQIRPSDFSLSQHIAPQQTAQNQVFELPPLHRVLTRDTLVQHADFCKHLPRRPVPRGIRNRPIASQRPHNCCVRQFERS